MSSIKEAPRTDAELSFDCELNDPPERVWRALTEPKLLSQWLMAGDFRPEVGAQCQLESPESVPVECTVLTVRPHKLLRYRWREQREDAPDTIVTFELTPTKRGGTHLRVIHCNESHLSCVGDPLQTQSSGRFTPRMRCAA